METYTFLREFADSWVLLAMTGFYLSAILWVFRPNAKAHYDAMAAMPLRDDDGPSCQNDCANCACKNISLELEDV